MIAGAIYGVRWLGPASNAPAAVTPKGPLVIIMDSPHPRRVYDPETLAANGSNADVIGDILSDLPTRRQKETIGQGWHRDEEVKQFQPDLNRCPLLRIQRGRSA
jgi:hypothetical protein